MKKVFGFLVLLVFILGFGTAISVSAAETSVVVKVNGIQKEDGGEKIKITKGEEVIITVDINNIKDLYTAFIDFKYDKDLLSITEMKVNKELIGKSYYQDRSNFINSKRARYCYSYIRPNLKGFTGSSNFITFKGTALKDGEQDVTNDIFKVQLVQRIAKDGQETGEMKYVDFDLVGSGQKNINNSDYVPEGLGENPPSESSDDRLVVQSELADIVVEGEVQVQNEVSDNSSEEINDDKLADNKENELTDKEGSKDDQKGDKINNIDDKERESKLSSNIIIYTIIGVFLVVIGVIIYRKKNIK